MRERQATEHADIHFRDSRFSSRPTAHRATRHLSYFRNMFVAQETSTFVNKILVQVTVGMEIDTPLPVAPAPPYWVTTVKTLMFLLWKDSKPSFWDRDVNNTLWCNFDTFSSIWSAPYQVQAVSDISYILLLFYVNLVYSENCNSLVCVAM
jgi:hypothetical protein